MPELAILIQIAFCHQLIHSFFFCRKCRKKNVSIDFLLPFREYSRVFFFLFCCLFVVGFFFFFALNANMVLKSESALKMSFNTFWSDGRL